MKVHRESHTSYSHKEEEKKKVYKAVKVLKKKRYNQPSTAKLVDNHQKPEPRTSQPAHGVSITWCGFSQVKVIKKMKMLMD